MALLLLMVIFGPKSSSSPRTGVFCSSLMMLPLNTTQYAPCGTISVGEPLLILKKVAVPTTPLLTPSGSVKRVMAPTWLILAGRAVPGQATSVALKPSAKSGPRTGRMLWFMPQSSAQRLMATVNKLTFYRYIRPGLWVHPPRLMGASAPAYGCIRPGLWVHPPQHPWEGNHLTQMAGPRNPGHRAL
jgi:hypothetical protein